MPFPFNPTSPSMLWFGRSYLEGPFTVTSGLEDTSNPATNGQNLQNAIDAANPGDVLVLAAGVQYTAPSTTYGFRLKDRGATPSTPITIRSSGRLPEAGIRLIPSEYAGSLAKLRQTSTTPVITLDEGAEHWQLIGLDIANTNTDTISRSPLLDFGSVNPTNPPYTTPAQRAGMGGHRVDRCFIHPADSTATSRNDTIRTSASYGIQCEVACTITCCDISGFAAKEPVAEGGESAQSYAILIIAGDGGEIVIDNNYLESHFCQIFTGGGNLTPKYSTTVTASTGTTATLASAANLAVNDYVAFDTGWGSATQWASYEVAKVTNINGNDITFDPKTTGSYTLSAITPKVNGKAEWYDGATHREATISAESGSVVTLSSVTGLTAGKRLFMRGAMGDSVVYLWTTVDSINGSDVTYTKNYGGTSAGFDPPLVGGTARWGSCGLPNLKVTRNYMTNREAWAAATYTKGYCEIKVVDRLLFEGNVCVNYPTYSDGAWVGGNLGFPCYNQNGNAPWSRIGDVTIRYNWFIGCRNGAAVTLSACDPYAITNGTNGTVLLEHNVFEDALAQTTNSTLLLHAGGTYASFPSITIRHNTIINVGSRIGTWDNSTCSDFRFADNVANMGLYGMNCVMGGGYYACWPGGEWANNLCVDAVDAHDYYAPGASGGTYVSDWAGVKFVDKANRNYRLASDSPGKNGASDGTDIGAAIDTLLAVLASTDRPVALA